MMSAINELETQFLAYVDFANANIFSDVVPQLKLSFFQVFT